MWRSASIIILLLAGSPALAGQATATFQVGITITGNPAQTPTRAKAPTTSKQAMAGLSVGARAAALKRSVAARPRPRRPQ